MLTVLAIALSRLNVSPGFCVVKKSAKIKWPGINTKGLGQETFRELSQKDTEGLSKKKSKMTESKIWKRVS